MASVNKFVGLVSVFFLMLLAAVPASFAVKEAGHVKLLAVYQEGEEFRGSPADVQLELKKGTGRVFIETIPLSKVDTQISTRFAKEIACKFAEFDCSKYDFFYTIRSTAGLIGGPSAGGAISALTVVMLKDLDVMQDVAMTGTINSGELIGPVGSLDKKIEAARETGIKKVIVPSVQASQKENTNKTITEYGTELGVEVIPVSTLADSVYALTGKSFHEEEKDIEVPENYKETMRSVARSLCDRSEQLLTQVNIFNLQGKKNIVFEHVNSYKEARNMTFKGRSEFQLGNTYSSASYCFGANVKLRTIIYDIKNMSTEESAEEAKRLAENINNFDRITDQRKKETISDLQTYMIVKERILEAKQNLITQGNTSQSFGYVDERINSGKAWSNFFGKDGEKYNLDEESLKSSCSQIVAEVNERFQYLNLFFPALLSDLQTNLLTARQHYDRGEYALCIYLAGRTKAEANIMVTMLGVKEEVVDQIVDQKVKAARRAVNKQTQKGIFPIIAYSYYEYASSLQKEKNNYAALLYSEYALELSDMDIYFKKKTENKEAAYFSDSTFELKNIISRHKIIFIFITGGLAGFLIGVVVFRTYGNRTKKPERIKKEEQPLKRFGKTKLRIG
jgi:predicted S18 family serine protease